MFDNKCSRFVKFVSTFAIQIRIILTTTPPQCQIMARTARRDGYLMDTPVISCIPPKPDGQTPELVVIEIVGSWCPYTVKLRIHLFIISVV